MLCWRCVKCTQKVLALKSGKAKGVRFDTLGKISHALDCQPGDLLEFTEARALVSKWVQIPNIWRLVPGLGPGYPATCA
ncbi:MAG: helix-turn-helix domain-containing protein [Planktomarina sp.]|nr:helix-turn-helix domain-containing protein [Planktomarina sp.]